MKKTTLSLLFTVLSTSFMDAKQFELNQPTEYIMQFLAASTTLWLGSDQWKDSIRRFETFRTRYAHDNVDVQYEVFISSENVSLKVNVKDTQEITAKTDEEFQEIMHSDNRRESIRDYSSECHVKTKINYADKDKRTVRLTKSGTCKSYVIEKTFLEKINSDLKK